MNIGDKYRVIGFDCGHTAKSRLGSLGITIGTYIEIIEVQPLCGPYTIKVGKSEYTIGRGLFSKIICEKIDATI